MQLLIDDQAVWIYYNAFCQDFQEPGSVYFFQTLVQNTGVGRQDQGQVQIRLDILDAAICLEEFYFGGAKHRLKVKIRGFLLQA